MIVEKKKRDKIFRIMNSEANRKFINRLSMILIALVPCNTGDEFNWCIMLCKMGPFILVVISLLGPFSVFFLLYKYPLPLIIIYLSILSSIFFSICISGIFGKGMHGCLAYPCNWLFLMLCSDLLTITFDATIIYFSYKLGNYTSEYHTFIVIALSGNIIFCIICMVQHIKAYKLINLIYTAIRTMEMDIIYYSVHKYLNCHV
jgi:hypothetical protein